MRTRRGSVCAGEPRYSRKAAAEFAGVDDLDALALINTIRSGERFVAR